MERQVKCECGYVARGSSDDEVLVNIREHMAADHPDLLDKISDAQIRDWIEIVS